jgi:type III secretory pathway component EscU
LQLFTEQVAVALVAQLVQTIMGNLAAAVVAALLVVSLLDYPYLLLL